MKTIKQAVKKHKEYGGHFFDPEAMQFFRSRIESELVAGHFFITSEQYGDDSPRLYTIRKIASDGQILSDVGRFQEFESIESAMNYLLEYAWKVKSIPNYDEELSK